MHPPTLFLAIGGTPACRQLSAAFYARVQRDPVLRPLFPGKTLKCATEELAAFLIQFLGGPAEDTQRRWWVSLHESHLRFKLGKNERAAWLDLMSQALGDVPIAEPARSALLSFFERSSAYIVGRSRSPGRAGADETPDGGFAQELALRWNAQRRRDEIVAAVRDGDADRAIALTETAANDVPHFSVSAQLLGLMLESGHGILLEYVRDKATRDPLLARERYTGRTLLHDAAAGGNLGLVEVLLDLGGDPNSEGGHSPLYCLANQCGDPGAGQIVRLLVRRGAKVDACDNVKRCTPLHMAARRGHVEVVAALLDCGAAIEARDSLGDTPLRRAVNCNKPDAAALLLARGADRQSRGSKGLTPVTAARTAAMRRLLQADRPEGIAGGRGST